jgi:hypothetical protein
MMSERAHTSVAAATPIRFTPVGTSAAVSDHPSVFERIFDEAVTVCVWNRQSDPILTNYLRGSVGSGSWERKARIDVATPQFEELLAGFEADVGHIHWVTELATLVDLFATLTDAQTVGLRVTATARATCPRFHSDQVGLRMLCSWVGEGTEWLAEEDVIRDPVRCQDSDIGLPAGPVRPGAIVRHMNSFAVGAFKGDLWPGSQGRGAVHRSPQPTGWRVFVSLDEL